MMEGSTVLVNGEHERIAYIADSGDMEIAGWHDDDFVFSVEAVPEDRYGPILDAYVLTI